MVKQELLATEVSGPSARTHLQYLIDQGKEHLCLSVSYVGVDLGSSNFHQAAINHSGAHALSREFAPASSNHRKSNSLRLLSISDGQVSRSEPLPVLNRREEGFDHLSVDIVPVELTQFR